MQTIHSDSENGLAIVTIFTGAAPLSQFVEDVGTIVVNNTHHLPVGSKDGAFTAPQLLALASVAKDHDNDCTDEAYVKLLEDELAKYKASKAPKKPKGKAEPEAEAPADTEPAAPTTEGGLL